MKHVETPHYTTFLNVTVAVRAKNHKAAYTKLCDALYGLGSWETTSYINDLGEETPTTELFPTRRHGL